MNKFNEKNDLRFENAIHPLTDFLRKILCLFVMDAASIGELSASQADVLCRDRAAVVRLLGKIVHQAFPDSNILIPCKKGNWDLVAKKLKCYSKRKVTSCKRILR